MNNEWEVVEPGSLEGTQTTRKSLTYWQDVWRRLRQNVMAMTGLVMIVIIALMAIFGPMWTTETKSKILSVVCLAACSCCLQHLLAVNRSPTPST